MKKWIIGIVLALMLGGNSLTVYAMSDIAENETIEEYFDELDFDEVDKVLEEKGTGITFRELVQMLIDGEKIDKGELLRNLLDVVFHEVLSFRLELLQIVLLCIVFSILYNFTNIFENPAVTQISFYMVYMLLMVLLLKSFWVLKDVVLAVLDDMLVFLKLLVPTFSLSMVFSGQMTAGSVFYELTFLLIYGIEWLMNGVIVPAIQIYVVVEMMNYLTEEEMLSKMTELLKEGIEWVLKLVFTTVIGINVVQNLLAPVIDGFKSTLISRTAGMIPGDRKSVV